MSTQLTGSSQAISLGEGYALRAPGVHGSADLKHPRSSDERARSRSADDGTEALDTALRAANITEVRQIDLTLQPTKPADATRSLRSVDGQEMLELHVPDLGPDCGQLVLACNETGVLTWHLPIDDKQQVQPPASRGSGGVKRFLIPATQPKPAPVGAGQRSLLGVFGKKLLKILVYPVLDPVIGAIGEYFAEKWEEKKRPYVLRDFSPANFRNPTVPALAASDWQRLSTGRALLFVHGTSSTAHAAFSQIPDETFKKLHQRYGGRVFAFNHFTLSQDPCRNIEWMLQQLPTGVNLEIDIVCHSRGGLVARTLAEQPSVFDLNTTRIKVNRVVFVAVPNHGTPLVDPDHIVKMIDRLTSALNLFPTGPVVEALEALIMVIKVIGHGALKSLDGLAAMKPTGKFLNKLNSGIPTGSQYYAIAANYGPTNQGLKALLTGAADGVIDMVFKEAANDWVVPEEGVYSVIANNNAFPIQLSQLYLIPPSEGVMHTTMFGHPPVSQLLDKWLV